MIRRPPRSTQSRSSAASDVYKRQELSLASLAIPVGVGLGLQQLLFGPSVRRLLQASVALSFSQYLASLLLPAGATFYSGHRSYLLSTKKLPGFAGVCGMHFPQLPELPLALAWFLGQQVAAEGPAPKDLALGSHLGPLLHAFMCLLFRHVLTSPYLLRSPNHSTGRPHINLSGLEHESSTSPRCDRLRVAACSPLFLPRCQHHDHVTTVQVWF